MKIIFVRHGETKDNLKGINSPVLSTAELTENGINEVRQLAQKLKKYNFEKIYYSPMQRTKQTAQIIASEDNIQTKEIEELKERDWGDWGKQGKTWAQVLEIIKDYDIKKRYEFTPTNGESWKTMEKRLIRFVEKIKKEYQKNVIIVTHTGCLRALLPVLKKDNITNHESYSVGTSTITVFCTEKNEYDIIGFKHHEILD